MADGIPTELMSLLREAYAVPLRHYHHFGHAHDVVQAVRMLNGGRACVLAAWAHDVIYDAQRDDNEEASARWLTRALPHDPDVMEAARLVRLTSSHSPDDGDTEGDILCDADLAILGSSAERYDRYVAEIRQEYAHVAPETWRNGRTEVLSSFLERPTIYRTVKGRALWESSARQNIAVEIAGLTSGS